MLNHEIKEGLNLLKPLLELSEPDWIRTNGLLLRSLHFSRFLILKCKSVADFRNLFEMKLQYFEQMVANSVANLSRRDHKRNQQ